MSDSSDNTNMVKGSAFKEPKRLKEIAMMKLIHMLMERFIPHILRLYQDVDSVDDFDAIKEEVLELRDWIYEPLSCSVANDVQELITKALLQLEDKSELLHHYLKYVHLLRLHPKCRNLSLSSKFFSRDVMEDVTDMLQSLICLEHIEWGIIELRGYEIYQFTRNLKYCTRLKVYKHQSECSDEIIKVLSQNCPLLEVLDIEGSKRVTDESVDYIENMKSLRKCCIKRTSITHEGVVSILKNCTQLYHLDAWYNICKHVEDFENADDPIRLSLRTVQLYYEPITPLLLKKYCPFLTDVDVGVEWRSKPPYHLFSAKRMTIKEPFPCWLYNARNTWKLLPSLYSALNTWLILENINVITLFRVEMSDKQLVELSSRCQNITELYAEEVHTNPSDMHNFSEHRTFQKLKILRFKVVSRQYQFETDVSMFKILLSYSTMVTHVDIKGLHIDDRTVETIFKTNKMRYLQYWRMEETVCTSETFYLLFNMCSMLKFIGKLRTWSLHPDEAQEVENFIRQENYNLDIDMSDSDALLNRYIYRARELLLKMVSKM